MKKILCIDDMPDQVLSDDGKSLRQILTEVFKPTSYELVFKTTSKEGIQAAMSDPAIKLVLLDIQFYGKAEGPEIATALGAHAPHLKIIVLTSVDEKGKKISFGWKPNVVNYVLKADIDKYIVLQQLQNLAKAVMEDYENKHWEVEFVSTGTINLKHSVSSKSYGINFPSSMDDAMKAAIAAPNAPIANPGGSMGGMRGESALNKVLNIVNDRVLNGTGWNTWGILSREQCAKGQFKLVIGSVASSSSAPPAGSSYVLSSVFGKYKEDMEKRLRAMEQIIRSKGHTL